MKALERLLLALFPRSFRRGFHDDLRASLREAFGEAAAAPSVVGRLRARGAVIADFVHTALAERLAGGPHPGRLRIAAQGLARDVSYALRQLRRSPGFTLAVVVTMAVGIGANTAVFSVLYGVLLKPLPFAEPERLVWVWGAAVDGETADLWRSAPGPLAATSLLSPGSVVLSGLGPAESLSVVATDAGFLELLGVTPVAGRWFDPDEVRAGEAVVVLRADEAARIFGSAEAAVGDSLRLDEVDHRVVGVIPREVASAFRFPQTRAWLPIEPAPHRFSLVARTRAAMLPSETLAALVELPAVAAVPEPRFGPRLQVESLHEIVVGFQRLMLQLLFAGVALVLLLACVNVAHLFLVRTGRRVQELSIRSSLGAGRGRLLRQLLVEGWCAALFGALAGLALVRPAVAALLAIAPTELVRAESVRTDPVVLGYALAVTVLVGTVFGALPALLLRRRDLHPARAAALGVSSGRGDRRLRAGLMLVQVALTVMVLGAAGLLSRALARLDPVNPGFNAESRLVFDIRLPGTRYPDGDALRVVVDRLLTEPRAVPGVIDAAAASDLPFGRATMILPVFVDAEPVDESTTIHTRIATPGYLPLLEVATVRGRAPDGGGPDEVWINQSAASLLWPESDAVGRTLEVELDGATRGFAVAGVVADIRHRGTQLRTWPEIFVPFEAAPHSRLSILLASNIAPDALARPVAEVVAAIDPLLPTDRMSAFRTVLQESVRIPRFNAVVMQAFAALTMGLACVGIFGIVSHGVAARRRELGIRLALGADARRIAGLVMRGTAAVLLAGVLLGLGGLWAGARWMESMLFGMPSADVAALSGAVAVMVVAALGAAAVPVARAARTDPTDSMRTE